MNWAIELSKNARKFLSKHQNLQDSLTKEVKKFIRRLNGEKVNLNVKQLHGIWEGFYRIRKGDIRIIFSVYHDELLIYIEKIDYRGDVYK